MENEDLKPLLSIAVEPKTKADQKKMISGLELLAADDPTFEVATNVGSGQTLIKGMDEFHLDRLIDRLKREFKVDANIGAPQVEYLETISKEIEHNYTHIRQLGGARQFAEVKLLITPTEPGEQFTFKNRIIGGEVPDQYIPGVAKGINSVRNSGPLAGFPVIDFKVALIDGKFHDVDSSVLAFEIAARMCMREGLRKAGCTLLEPIMAVEVVTPEEYSAGIIGDLKSRRGLVKARENRDNVLVLNAMVPFGLMFGYINTLRSMSSGKAKFSMKFDHYSPVPSNDNPDDNFPPAIGMRA